jgi:CheY-like chemotaxis protein
VAQYSTFPVHNVRNWKVLIVDDVSDNLTVLEYTLRHHGATTYRAYNGQEGLALIEQVNPNLILLDIAMPVMDGWQMLTHLRAEQRYATIPVIAVTAHAMEGDRAQALGAGFDGYISKPFNVFTLLQDIQTCFP